MGIRDASVPEMYIFFMLCLFTLSSSDLIINTNTGPVQGVASLADDVEAFLGIPYAEPPVGELRFAKPVPRKKWNGIYNAEKLPPACIQSDIFPYYFLPDLTNMTEDCLYLNLWTPKSEPVNELRPVIIFLHHGSFVTGSSSQKTYDGSQIASRGDIVFVTVNYRLGALGFLLSHTEEAEGNMGMYDQLLAIKWVKENAAFFSGDPENIVLMGSSAGAYSVSAHLLSPLSNHLINKAIIHSGSMFSPLFEDENAKLFENSQAVAALVGCTDTNTTLRSDPHSVMKCLKTIPSEAFADAQKALLSSKPVTFYPRYQDKFLPRSYIDLVREGKFRKDIDVLTGITSAEGSVMMIVGLREYLGDYGELYTKMNKHRVLAMARGAALYSGHSAKSTPLINFYMSTVKNRSAGGYTKMLGDIIGDYSIACCTIFLADFLSLKGNNVYFYKFDFRPPSTPMADWVEATHMDELQYVFGNPYFGNFTSEELELSQRLIDRWTTFARKGNPNVPGHVPWFQYNYNTPLYLHIGQEEESIRLRPNLRCEYWRKEFRADLNRQLIRVLTNSGMRPTKMPFFNFFSTFSAIISMYITFHNNVHSVIPF